MLNQSALFLAIVCGTMPATAGASDLPESLEILPARARLSGPEATQRLVVLGVLADGSRVDMTPRAQFESTQPGVLTVDGRATIHPVADGDAEVVVRVGSAEARVPVGVERAAADRLLAALADPAVAPPSLTDLAVDPEVIAALVHLGQVVRVSESAAFLADTFAAMVDWTLATIDATGSVTVAAFRDHFGTSRKHALAVLEALDQRRVTRRQGDARVRW